MLVIGFAGVIEVGKSEMAKGLHLSYPNTFRRSFAAHLKDCVKFMFRLTDWHVNTSEGKRTIIPALNITVRRALQLVGTDFARNMIHKDFWVMHERSEIGKFHKDSIIIYDDVRFPNECNLIHDKKGIVIYLSRDFESTATEEEKNHDSENILSEESITEYLHLPNNIKTANEIVHETIIKFTGERDGKRVQR